LAVSARRKPAPPAPASVRARPAPLLWPPAPQGSATVGALPGVAWRPSDLEAQGYEPIKAEDRTLAKAAGGLVIEAVPPIAAAVPGYKAPRGRRYWAAGLVVRAIAVARAVARRTGANPRDVLLALNRAGLVDPVGNFGETGNFHADEINGALAGILGVPVVTGPIRSWPSGRYDIQRSDGSWVEATDELLGALDAESRLDGKQTIEHFAAQTILQWQGKEGASG
jgi:hypothetical protein